jgi:hypothetical protein
MPYPMKFPTVIDNSMREAFFSCPQKFKRSYLQNLTMPAISVHLHAGASYAKGLEDMRRDYYENGVDAETALATGLRSLAIAYGDFQCPAASPKTAERMMGALEFYTSAYPLSMDYVKPFMAEGKAALEFTFAIELPIAHPDTGEPLIYAGRFDMLAKYRDDMLVVYDDKTASQLGASWSEKWHLSSQFTGYTWAARAYGFDVQAVIVRGVSILKTQYGTAEVISYRPQWMLDRWYEQLLHEIRQMIAFYTSDYFPLSQSDACSSYGGCMFKDLCDKQNPENWIESQFITREYNPLWVAD